MRSVRVRLLTGRAMRRWACKMASGRVAGRSMISRSIRIACDERSALRRRPIVSNDMPCGQTNRTAEPRLVKEKHDASDQMRAPLCSRCLSGQPSTSCFRVSRSIDGPTCRSRASARKWVSPISVGRLPALIASRDGRARWRLPLDGWPRERWCWSDSAWSRWRPDGRRECAGGSANDQKGLVVPAAGRDRGGGADICGTPLLAVAVWCAPGRLGGAEGDMSPLFTQARKSPLH